MLEIKTDKGCFVLYPDTKILFDLVSDFFNNGIELLGSKTYPFDLPLSENAWLINNGHLIENRAGLNKEIPVQVAVSGISFKKCKLRFETGDKKLRGILKVDMGEVASSLKTIKLSEMDFGNYNNIGLGNTRQEVIDYMTSTVYATPGSIPFVFFPQLNQRHMGEQFFDSVINDFSPYSGQFLLGPDVNAKKYIINPSFYLSWLLKQVCSMLGFEAYGDWFADPELNSLVIWNNVAYSYDDNSLFIYISNHLPDWTIADFIKELKKGFGMNIYFDSDKLTAKITCAAKELASPEFLDLTKYLNPGYKLGEQKAKRYELMQNEDEDYLKLIEDHNSVQGIKKFREDFPTKRTYGDIKATQIEKYDCKFSTMRSWLTLLDSTRSLSLYQSYTPMDFAEGVTLGTRYAATLEGLNIIKNKKADRLLFFRGLQPNHLGYKFPMASSETKIGDNYPLENGTDLFYNSLNLSSPKGPYEKLMKPLFQFLRNTDKVPVRMLLPMGMVTALRFGSKVGLSLRNNVLTTGMIGRVQFELPPSAEGLVTTEVDFYPILTPANDMGSTESPTGEDPVTPIELIFVKMGMANRESKQEYINSRFVRSELWDIKLFFYKDRLGQVPLSVNNLRVNYEKNYTNQKLGTNITTPDSIVCTGTEVTILRTYVTKDTYWAAVLLLNRERQSFKITEGPYYNILN